MAGPLVPIYQNNFEVRLSLFKNKKKKKNFVSFIKFLGSHCILFAGDGIVVKGRAYGIRSIRVDGNDALAVYSAIQAAREMAISEKRPVLVEVRLNFF